MEEFGFGQGLRTTPGSCFCLLAEIFIPLSTLAFAATGGRRSGRLEKDLIMRRAGRAGEQCNEIPTLTEDLGRFGLAI